MSDAPHDPIEDDPFWSVVRRRHPELDIVILPPERPHQAESGLPARAPEPFEALQISDADALWDRLVGHGMPYRSAQWIPGPTTDSVCHTASLSLDGVSAAVGIAHLREALDLLPADGWDVFAPPTGMPRITASQRGELGPEELLFGFAPDAQRLFLRLTSTGLTVGTDVAFQLIEGAS